MTKDEALKLALEALWTCSEGDYSTGYVIHPTFDEVAVEKAIHAIKEALAQPEQDWEAVAADQAMTIALLKVDEPVQRKPLTDEELAKTLGFWEHTTESTRVTLTNLARAIEAAHGIKE